MSIKYERATLYEEPRTSAAQAAYSFPDEIAISSVIHHKGFMHSAVLWQGGLRLNPTNSRRPPAGFRDIQIAAGGPLLS